VSAAETAVTRISQADADTMSAAAALEELRSDEFREFVHHKTGKLVEELSDQALQMHSRLFRRQYTEALQHKIAYAAKAFGVQITCNVPHISPLHQVQVVDLVISSLVEAKDAQRPLPKAVVFDVGIWNALKFVKKKKTTLALTDPDSQVVWLNPMHRYWKGADFQRRAMIEEMAGSKLISTGNVKHVMRHEIGHLEHPLINGKRDYLDAFSMEFTQDDFVEIKANVSRISLKAPAEFVVEVRCGLLEGIQYSDRIMELYRLLYGVE